MTLELTGPITQQEIVEYRFYQMSDAAWYHTNGWTKDDIRRFNTFSECMD